jgi:hypothetical protein
MAFQPGEIIQAGPRVNFGIAVYVIEVTSRVGNCS